MLRMIIIGLAMLAWGCQKTENDLDQTIAFYNLKKFDTSGPGFAINESTAKPGNELLIAYEDIIAYNSRTHAFIIREALSREIDVSATHRGYYQKPFALAIGKEIIYTGYFWSLISSTSCDWLVAVPLGQELKIFSGYPGVSLDQPIPDRRNDPRLLEILKRDGKLVE